MPESLSPSQLARAIGVSESSLKRWVDEGALTATRTIGGHRRISIAEAVRFIRKSGAAVVRPDLLGLAVPKDLPTDWTEGAEVDSALYRALELGEATKVRAMVQGLYVAGWSPAAIFDGPFRRSLQALGELWQHADWGIVVEHRATSIAIAAVTQLRGIMASPASGAPTAVGGALGQDPYMLPSLMCATVLAEAGYADVNLGPVTPVSVLKNAIEFHGAKLAWASVSQTADPVQTSTDIDDVAKWCAARGCAFVVGGREVSRLNLHGVSDVQVCENLAGLETLANRLCGRSGGERRGR